MIEVKKPERGPGRPRKYSSDAKRSTLTFRVRDGLYERLLNAANKRELSISEEIERRLLRSFLLGSMYDSRHETEDLTAMLNSAIIYAQARTGKTWRDDNPTRRIVAASLHKIAEMIDLGDDGEGRDAGHIDRESRVVVEQAEGDINAETGVDPAAADLAV